MTTAFLPIDFPKAPYNEEKYWEFFDRTFKRGVLRWDTTVIRKNSYADRTGIKDAAFKYVRNGQWYWTDDVMKELPELVEMIESLPFRYISYVGLMSNHEVVNPHQDFVRKSDDSPVVKAGSMYPYDWEGYNYLQEEYKEESAAHEPSNYRILLAGDRETSFFVCRNDMSGKTHCKLPVSTDTFAFNNTECHHGADMPKEGRKLLVFISAWLDFDKHENLVANSITKYGRDLVQL